MGITINHTQLAKVIPVKRSSCNIKTRYITEILQSEAWIYRKCLLIGGGPSLKDFDFNLIKNELTIGINKSFIKFPTTLNYAMDSRFYDMVTYPTKENLQLHQQWLNYKGIKVFLKGSQKFKFEPDVYLVNSLSDKAISFDLEKGIWAGSNSGFGALMLAIALGCTKIGLLGYSMSVDHKNNKTHWHDGYSYQNLDSLESKLERFMMCFQEFSPSIEQLGIQVVNLDFSSKLNCFSKDSLQNFLAKS